MIEAHPSMHVVGEAGTGRAAIQLLRESDPDACVLDFHLPDMNGAAVLEAALQDGVATNVLVLSGSADNEAVYAMLEAGAAGFLRKTATADEILGAVLRASRGETVLPPDEVGGIAEQIRARRSNNRPSLTERELGLLSAMAEGNSASEIAAHFNLAESTVKTHLTRIYDKLGVSERAAAVAVAIRSGLID